MGLIVGHVRRGRHGRGERDRRRRGHDGAGRPRGWNGSRRPPCECDFARAFTGPGLIDLASYHGTTDTPSLVRLRVFLEQYVTVGGHEGALAARGGLAAEAWALGWRRMWAVEWCMEQAVRWINDLAKDPAYIPVVRRHLNDVLQLLGV